MFQEITYLLATHGYCLLLYATVKEGKINKHLFIQVTYTSPNTFLTTVLTMNLYLSTFSFKESLADNKN